jgi:sigma-B regulation protein RsbU (phosphoserine phosphatase)
VLRSLNEVLLAQGTERFCTVVLVRLRQDGSTWTATLSSGGHPLPLLTSRVREPDPVGAPGSLIGVLTDVRFHDEVVRLQPGDVMVLFTDGVTEGRSGAEFYGDERLRESVRAHRDAPRPAESVLGEVLEFQHGAARDDIAVVSVRVPPPSGTAEQQVREESAS